MKTPITPADFRDTLKKGLRGGWLFYGEEAYLKQHALTEVRKTLGGDSDELSLSHRKLSCAEFDIEAMTDAVATVSLLDTGDKRLTEFHELPLNSLKENEWKQLLSLLEELPNYPDTVLILYTTPEELDVGSNPKMPSKAFTRLSEYLTPVHFAHETDARLLKWVGKHFSAQGIVCPSLLGEILLAHIGHDMFTLAHEIDKLCAYLSSASRTELTEEDVYNVCAHNLEADAFAFSNALLERNCDRAYALLNDMRLHKEKPVFVLSTVARVAVDLLAVKQLSAAGMPIGEIAKKLKMHEYKAGLYQRFARDRSDRKLRSLVDACADIDYKMKSSTLDEYTMLSRLVVLMAAK